MARGNAKLGGRGRGRALAEETGPVPGWPADGAATPTAPSPARNILPGEPFEPVAAAFPAQRHPEPAPFPTAAAGWGYAPAPGAPASGPGPAPDPALFSGEAAVLSWPNDESTGPMPAVPSGQDPLDALQQYAGLPVGAAPAPDPAQLYQSHPTGAPGPAAPAFDSGFADGGIFTGSEPFDGIPAAGQPLASPPGLPHSFAAPNQMVGYVPQSSLEPLDVTPGATGLLGDVLPTDQPEGGHRGGRRRAGGRRRDAGQVEPGDEAPNNGAKRAVALLGALAVLGAAGYLGYTQLSGTDSTASSPITSAKPATTARYELPAQLANLAQITPAQTKALTAGYTRLAAKNAPNLPPAVLASAYRQPGSAQAGVNVVVFRPGSTAAYDALLGSLSRPGPGSASVAATPVAPGAAGGTLMCGSQRGASPAAWCAWNSPKGMGFLQTKGTANPAYAAVYTRELRAFAER